MHFLWKESYKRGIIVDVKGAWKEKKRSVNDVFLMDEIVKKISDPILQQRINSVRLYLKVLRLSDIANKEGNKIEQWALYGPPKQGTEL